MTKPALLIIDMCRDFFEEGRLSELRTSLVESINELAAGFRRKDFPVIWVRQEFESDLSDAFLSMKKSGQRITIKGTGGELLLPELDVQESDGQVIKKRYSAFYKTNLDEILDRLKPTHLVLAGVNTHACIRTAAVDGFQRDFEIIIADQGVNSYDVGFHEDSKRYLEGRVGTFLSNAEIQKKFAPM